MALEADRGAIQQAAAGWAGIGQELGFARLHVGYGESKGHEFGWYAQRASIDSEHNTFITAMTAALEAGEQQMAALAGMLAQMAEEFAAKDADVADRFHQLETPHG